MRIERPVVPAPMRNQPGQRSVDIMPDWVNRPYRPSTSDVHLIQEMLFNFGALEDRNQRGLITLDSLMDFAYPAAGRRMRDFALRNVVRDFLQRDELRALADQGWNDGPNDKYEVKNLLTVLEIYSLPNPK
ncbi:hypothetical protein EXW72_02480 [Pseudomonas sp. BCA14]|uniref:hypothetical protein n=1 Tax=unclassified Pseudomonas TaxID=196821 RepID=UPI00106E16B7|nr:MULTISPECIES: hypothetical protein [unclassified Pseudomonas]TFF13179.1 hypothetical protein EXW70_01210 [Pseudomonas sp. JMN1]TFF16137.1 hypothetical protein EXW71_07830 [Pseudomonas sp. BCA17]TFF30073.1 hypothetical protein EXW73_07065 [Pseudomonas sp. BCA13]TFF30915.1 hypothetical protein EXW72_02480 [Pseudomonas sp. BCA14]